MDGVNYSMKSEGAKSIKPEKITISKFMEARWIRGKNPAALAQEANQRIQEHLSKYERVLILRGFTLGPDKVKYQLVEIPRHILMLAARLKGKDIKLPSGKSVNQGGSSQAISNGGGTAIVQYNGATAFKVRFDGSVEKIIIENLDVDLCTIHATWIVPTTIPTSKSAEE
uniref:Type II site-specific deoxyribonuclease n=1 Tax=Cyanothece sp. (strain PCC 7425 / ATCC 29141) TaxID=395961 RepID=B8HXN5_CYAP4